MTRIEKLLTLGLASMGLLVQTGCSGSFDVPLGQKTPYLQGVLDPSRSIQSIWVEWGTPSDSSFDASIRPVDTSLVHVVLFLPDGSQAPFLPAAGIPGRFDVGVSILPESTYTIRGTVDNVAVTATVTVPGVLQVLEPVSDTIRLSAVFLDSVRFKWSSKQASLFVAQLLATDGSTQGLTVTSDSVDFIPVFRSADTIPLLVRSYEGNAAGFLFSSPPATSARGIAGFLGAVATGRRFTILWQ